MSWELVTGVLGWSFCPIYYLTLEERTDNVLKHHYQPATYATWHPRRAQTSRSRLIILQWQGLLEKGKLNCNAYAYHCICSDKTGVLETESNNVWKKLRHQPTQLVWQIWYPGHVWKLPPFGFCSSMRFSHTVVLLNLAHCYQVVSRKFPHTSASYWSVCSSNITGSFVIYLASLVSVWKSLTLQAWESALFLSNPFQFHWSFFYYFLLILNINYGRTLFLVSGDRN